MAAAWKLTQDFFVPKTREVEKSRNPENLVTASGYAAVGNRSGVALLAGASF